MIAEAADSASILTKHRRPLWKYRGFWLCLWVFLGLAVPLGWLALRLFGARPAFVISKQTTRLTEPLRADGYLDFPRLVKERYSLSAESSAESFMMQVRVTGSGWDSIEKPDFAVGVFGACRHALNVDDATNEESGLDAFALSQHIESQCFSKPFTSLQQPLVAAATAHDRDWYERLDEASYLPARIGFSDSQRAVGSDSRDPCTFEFDTDQIDSGTYMRKLAFRILLALGEGRVDQALRDLETWQRLDHINEVVPTGLWGTWSLNVPSIQEIVAILILSTGPLSVEESDLIESLSGEIPNERFLNPIDDRIRIFCLDSLQSLHQSPRVFLEECSSLEEFIGKRWKESLEDWGRRAAEQNQFLDLIIESLPDARTYDQQCDALQLAYDTVREGRSEDGQVDVLLWSAFSCRNYLRAFNRRVALRRFARAAKRLADYRRANNQYPEKLELLDPDAESGGDSLAFEDPFNGKPLAYCRTESGFILYSVGPNCEGDFGYSDPEDLPLQHQGNDYEDLRTGRVPDDITFRWNP